MPSKRKFWKRADVIIIGVLLLIALSFWLLPKLLSPEGRYAEIYIDQTHYQTVDLTGPDQTIELDRGFPVTIEVRDGKIGFAHANCPDKVCERTGFLKKSGETAVCMPAKVLIRVKSGSAGLDALAG